MPTRMESYTETDGEFIRTFLYKPETSVFFKTKKQDVAILDTPTFGRTLFLDGILQSSEKDEEIYHRKIVHPVMFHLKDKQNVLILGGGEGATLREVCKYDSEKIATITMIDWDQELVNYYRNHEPTWHKGAFEDLRVRLEFADVFDLIGQTREYDVIIVDLIDPDVSDPRWKELLKTLYSWLPETGTMSINAGGFLPWDMKDVVELEQYLRKIAGLQKVFKMRCFCPSFGREWAILTVTPPYRR